MKASLVTLQRKRGKKGKSAVTRDSRASRRPLTRCANHTFAPYASRYAGDDCAVIQNRCHCCPGVAHLGPCQVLPFTKTKKHLAKIILIIF
jgi:hypothetical protein